MNSEIKTFEKNSKIFRQGEKAAAAYLIKSGVVRIYLDEAGQQKEIARLSEGEIFGEMALIEVKYHTMNAEAVSRTELILIRPEELEAKLRKVDPLIKSLINMFIDRMRKSNEEVLHPSSTPP
jgi:CRP-like cAMP-binding protein